MRTVLRFIMLLIGISSLSILLMSIYQFVQQLAKDNEKTPNRESKKDMALNEKYRKTDEEEEVLNVVRLCNNY